MSSWRLIHNITVFMPSPQKDGENLIFLANNEETKFKSAVVKSLDSFSGYSKFDIDDGRYSIRITKAEDTEENETPFVVQIKSDSLPDKDAWYSVGNFCSTTVSNLILENTIVDGEIEGDDFEITFSDDYPNKIAFVSSRMPSYSGCVEELRRRLSCEFGKKTKKLIPGHRYDTADSTIYYLGEYLSRRGSIENSRFLDPSDAVPVYLYVENIRCKSLEELFNTETFGTGKYDIHITYKTKMMIDSGEELKNDLNGKGIQDFWKIMWANTFIKKCTVVNEDGYSYYTNLKDLFDPLSLLSTGDTTVYVDMKDEIKNTLRALVNRYIVDNWNLKKVKDDLEISSSKTTEQNAVAITMSMFSGPIGIIPEDENVMSCSYYIQLIRSFGIDEQEIFKSELDLFNEDDLCTDFDQFTKYQSYFLKRKTSAELNSQQRQKTTKYAFALKYLKDLYGEGKLTEVIKEIVKDAENTFGLGVEKYSVYNTGTTTKPCEFVDCTVSLDNIIKYFGGKDKVPQALKDEILDSKFCAINIKYDKGEEVL